jgi:phosphoglycolate phosphatase
MTAPRTLLFDLDGTLTDNFEGIAASIRHALACLGAAMPDAATLRTCVGPPLRESFARLLGTGDPALIERAVAHYRERFAAVGWRENVLYAGVAEVLAGLEGEARLFVCTAKPAVFARRIVVHFGLAPRFAGVYGADLDGAFDDKARLVAHLVAVEGVVAESAIMIGDRANDVRAAHANGLRAVGVLWGYGTPEELAAADAVAATPRELVALLRPNAQSSA